MRAGRAFAAGLDREPSPGTAWPAGGSAGGLVALLSERDLTGSGIEVEFFGEPPGSWAARPRSPNRPEPR